MADGEESQQGLAEKLNATGAKLAELSSKATKATKATVSKTNAAVRKAVSDSKAKIDEKREERRDEKVRKAKDGLSSEGLIDDAPPMITLPEFEDQRMVIVTEQQDNQLLLMNHMQMISERIDILERRQKARIQELEPAEVVESNSSTISLSNAAVELMHILGASMIWMMILIGVDIFIEYKGYFQHYDYPPEIFIWSIGTMSWALFIQYRLTKSGIMIPMRVQIKTALAVGIITLIGVMMNSNSMTTVSSVWGWVVVITFGLLIGSSLVTTDWNNEG